MSKPQQPAFATYKEWIGRNPKGLPDHFKKNAKASIVQQGGDWEDVAISMHIHKSGDPDAREYLAFASAPIFGKDE